MEPEEERRVALERLQILDAMLTAIDRRAEFLALVGDSESADHARSRLRAEWGMSEVQAQCVLDLQMRRFARQQRELIAAERVFVERRVGDVTD